MSKTAESVYRVAVLLLASLCLQGCVGVAPAPALQAERLAANTAEVIRLRHGLKSVTEFLATQPGLFPAQPSGTDRLLRREDKEIVWGAWQRFLDLAIALDSLERAHRPWPGAAPGLQAENTLIKQAAFLAQYRGALDFIARVDHNPALDKILNEPVPELGLPGGTYARLKLEFLNPAIATEFAARRLVSSGLLSGSAALNEAIREDATALWSAGVGSGVILTTKNAWKIIERTTGTAWLPIQSGVAAWMGDTKVYRPHRNLIPPEQVQTLAPRLEPGDIMLERREWYLSNIGLPGYWPHATLYVGTPEERRRYFDCAEIRTWLAAGQAPTEDFETFLAAREPAAYAIAVTADAAGHPPRIIEALSEGVSFTTVEHSAGCDALAVLRPRVSRVEKARAILRAFHYSGRPYDFDFDFATDASLVCTELIYKAYEPATDFGGLRLEPGKILGRLVLPANEIARQFDAEQGQPGQQFDFVLFLDGRERSARATEASVEDFRLSWRRPKWHIVAAPAR